MDKLHHVAPFQIYRSTVLLNRIVLFDAIFLDFISEIELLVITLNPGNIVFVASRSENEIDEI